MDTREFSMNYGAILGFFLVAIATLMWSFGLASGLHIPFLLNNGLVIFGIAYTIINFRDAENNGVISYSESVRLGTSTAFFSSLILAFYTFVFMKFIGPDTNILTSIKAEAVEAILQQNLESEEEENSLNLIDKIITLKWWIIGGTLAHTLIGFIYSLIISIFVKKSDHTLTSILIDENTKTTPIFKGLLFENYLKTFKNYSDFNGRSSVREFWMFLLFNIIIMLTLFVVDFLLVYLGGTPIISSIFSLLTFIPTLAVGVRRMHDIGKPGWYILIPLYNLILSTVIGDKGKNNYGPYPDIE